MRIVVRVPNWIGDVVFALPALRSVQAGFPGAAVSIAGPSWAGSLLAGTEFSGMTIPLSGVGKSSVSREAAAALKAGSFNAGILLTNSFSSALLFRQAGIPERWGYKTDGRGLLLTRGVRRPASRPAVHMVRYYLGLLEGLGIPTLPPSIDLSVPAEAKERAGRRLAGAGIDSSRPLVLLAPGAAHGPAKRWPAARFGETAALLRKRTGAAIVVVGTAAEAPLAAEIAAAAGPETRDFTGKTDLAELFGLLERAAALVTNDSGPLHMANALRVPVVAVFGPTDPRATGPFHEPFRVLRRDGIPCQPCKYRACPYDHRCMALITAAEAAAAVEELLE
jgi:heptosyltransferase-2